MQRTEIEFLLLADAVENVNGKLYVMGGGWDRFGSSNYPTIARLGIAASVLVPREVAKKMQRLRLQFHFGSLASPSAVSMDLAAQVETINPPGYVQSDVQRVFVVVNGNFPLPQPGKYEIRAQLPDGQEKAVQFEAAIVQLGS
jgi:hypothetical protein